MNTSDDDKFTLLVLSLQARLGRLPTEDEVIRFINGTQQERQAIWDLGADTNAQQD